MRWLLGVLLLPVCLQAATKAADLTRAIREITLDADECYRVREISFSKDEVRLYLTDGYLIFGKPINGVRTAAVFTTDVEGGEGEILVLPPNRSERHSLAGYTGAPNLEESIQAAIFIFGDDTDQQLFEQIRANPFPKKSPEMGLLMAQKWNSAVRNLSSTFETRLVEDLLSTGRRQSGFFTAALSGKKLGNFDLVYDPREAEQLLIGQVATRDLRSVFNVWTSFESLPFRKGTRTPLETTLVVKEIQIDATIESGLRLRAVTRAKVTPTSGSERVLPFQISRRMRITAASVDGQTAEVLQREAAPQAGFMGGEGNELILVVPAQALEAGREYLVEIRHEGGVIFDAGNEVYAVSARGSWYPNHNMQFSRYDITFRYPRNLDLVTAGEIVEDKTEGEWRITRRVTSAPIRLAGFNLGHYQRERVVRGDYTVEVFANRKIEKSLQPVPLRTVVRPDVPSTTRERPLPEAPPPPTPNPSARLPELAGEVASALEFMGTRFGPPVLKHLVISPVPGTFGQGFGGLIYLSTLSYLRPQERASVHLNESGHSFFTDLLQAHETAHQWWGNVVTSSGYHDDWLMESLANYSALLYMEKHSGRRAVDLMLEEYKNRLLSRTASKQTLESTGPIALGPRLENLQAPFAWEFITYGKGSWILHMLRAQLGDERFLAMLGELRRRYEWKSITTEQFRHLAAEFLPPKFPDPKLESFFDQWVYATGIPTLKLTYTVQGKAPALKLTGTISQSDVDDDFSVLVPVETQVANTKKITWVETANTPVTFTVTLPQAPDRVTLDPGLNFLRK